MLGDLGFPAETPLLAYFKRPVEVETRWREGLYLGTPEEWDDPYRFFRW
ncbi:MAG: hypothetical protein ACI9R3_005164 [Verrucomicrobiales bacterium]